MLPGRSPLRLRWWCPYQASSFPRDVLASLCVIRTPPLSLSEKGLIQGIGEAAWSLSRAAGMGTEQFKAEREPHKTSSCANAPWRGCRPEECVLPPQLTSPPYPLNASKALPSHGCESRLEVGCFADLSYYLLTRLPGCPDLQCFRIGRPLGHIG